VQKSGARLAAEKENRNSEMGHELKRESSTQCARERLTLELAGERQRLERRIENRICCNSTVSKYEDRKKILEANRSAWMALESRPAGKS
jgi:hypothetical protein